MLHEPMRGRYAAVSEHAVHDIPCIAFPALLAAGRGRHVAAVLGTGSGVRRGRMAGRRCAMSETPKVNLTQEAV